MNLLLIREVAIILEDLPLPDNPLDLLLVKDRGDVLVRDYLIEVLEKLEDNA